MECPNQLSINDKKKTEVMSYREMCVWNVNTGHCIENAKLPYRHTAICVSIMDLSQNVSV